MRRLELVSDCQACAALCCVAPAFEASEDFAFDKPAGKACELLSPDCRCSIHPERVQRGFPGCTIYECHGAGQRVTRAFAAVAADAAERNAAFLRVRGWHELLWLLVSAQALCPVAQTELRAELTRHIELLDSLAQQSLAEELDASAHAITARALLRRVGDALGGRRSLRVLAAS